MMKAMTKTCTIGPTAVHGTRCGEPAVYTWVGDDGFEYAECARHYPGFPVGGRGGARVGDKVVVHRYGKEYEATVVYVGPRGRVEAEFTYGNGTKRRVRV